MERLPKGFEIDLIFPRENQTYKNIAFFPVVLGVQNGSDLWNNGYEVDISLWPLNLENQGDGWFIALGDDDRGYPQPGVSTAAEPDNLIAYSTTVNGTNGTWVLEVDVHGKNCSWDESRGAASDISTWSKTWRIMFNISDDGKLPDIEDAKGKCPTPVASFEIAKNASIEGEAINGPETCPLVFSKSPEPCLATADKSLADEVAAAIMNKTKCADSDMSWPQLNDYCLDSSASQVPRISAGCYIVLAMLTGGFGAFFLPGT